MPAARSARPNDISVVGFDNQEMISAHMHPALTTVGLPQYELGVMGVRTLLRQCGRDEDDGDEHVVTRTSSRFSCNVRRYLGIR